MTPLPRPPIDAEDKHSQQPDHPPNETDSAVSRKTDHPTDRMTLALYVARRVRTLVAATVACHNSADAAHED